MVIIENPPLAKVGMTRNRGDKGGFYDEKSFRTNRTVFKKIWKYLYNKSPLTPLFQRGEEEKSRFRETPNSQGSSGTSVI